MRWRGCVGRWIIMVRLCELFGEPIGLRVAGWAAEWAGATTPFGRCHAEEHLHVWQPPVEALQHTEAHTASRRARGPRHAPVRSMINLLIRTYDNPKHHLAPSNSHVRSRKCAAVCVMYVYGQVAKVGAPSPNIPQRSFKRILRKQERAFPHGKHFPEETSISPR